MICLEDENVLTRKRICETLERIFASKSASTVSTHIFGSSINGLGLKGCDLDVYVDVPGNPKSFENGSQGMFVFGFEVLSQGGKRIKESRARARALSQRGPDAVYAH